LTASLSTPKPIVVDDLEGSLTTTTIPDFVTDIPPKPSKGKEKEEGAPSKVATDFREWNT